MPLSIPKPPTTTVSNLKATTRAMLAGHALRQRAMSPDEAVKITLTPWSPSIHGASFLLHVWLAAVQSHEHVDIFGPSAETVESFVQTYKATEILVIHRSDAEEWMHGQGWLAIAFIDDADGGARARVHHYVRPEWRTRDMTQGLSALVLHYLFESRGFCELYGLTPAQNRAALRFAYRQGFTRYGLKSMMYRGQIVDGIESKLLRETWAARRMLEG